MNELASRLSPLTVVDIEGRPVVLGTLWAERGVVLIWLRHYG